MLHLSFSSRDNLLSEFSTRPHFVLNNCKPAGAVKGTGRRLVMSCIVLTRQKPNRLETDGAYANTDLIDVIALPMRWNLGFLLHG